MARIVIAGAGAIGASVAYHLARSARVTSYWPTAARSPAARRQRRWAACGSSSRPRPRCGSRRRASASSRSSARRCSIRSATCSSRRPRRGSPSSRSGASCRTELGVPVERSTRRSSTACGTTTSRRGLLLRTDGVADPPAVTRELVRRALELGVEVREQPTPRPLDRRRARDRLRPVVGGAGRGARGGAAGAAALPPAARDDAAAELPDALPMVLEAETGFHFRRRGERLVLAMIDPAPRWGFDEQVDETLFDDRLERLAHRYPPAADATIERGVGRPLRHDPRRAPDPRRGRRRRLRRMRLLGPRLHAVARGRPRSGRGDPRRDPESRPQSVPRSSASSGRRVPRDASPLEAWPRSLQCPPRCAPSPVSSRPGGLGRPRRLRRRQQRQLVQERLPGEARRAQPRGGPGAGHGPARAQGEDRRRASRPPTRLRRCLATPR